MISNDAQEEEEEEADDTFVKVFKALLLIKFLCFPASAFPRL